MGDNIKEQIFYTILIVYIICGLGVIGLVLKFLWDCLK